MPVEDRRGEETTSLCHLFQPLNVLIQTLFSLSCLLQVLALRSCSQSLIKNCLKTLRLSLAHKPLSPPLISLLPLFLNSKCAEFSSLCAEIVGAASLLSIEMNEVIASDGEIIGGLLSASMGSDRAVSVAACNALLDLSTTSIGRNKLRKFSALERLTYAVHKGERKGRKACLCRFYRNSLLEFFAKSRP